MSVVAVSLKKNRTAQALTPQQLHTNRLVMEGLQYAVLPVRILHSFPAYLDTLAFFFFFKQKTAYEISECDWSSDGALPIRSEEHTSELQSHSEISYAVFCLRLV